MLDGLLTKTEKTRCSFSIKMFLHSLTSLMAVHPSIQWEFEDSNRPNWWVFYTGGLLTTGGLGWCLRLAYMQEPKVAIASYSIGSTGIILMNLALMKTPGKYGRIPTSNCLMMLTGGIISGCGFGYCLSCGLKENPTSALIAYTIGSLGYIMTTVFLYTMSENVETEMSRKKRKTEQQIMREVYKMVDSARFNFMSNEIECKECEEEDRKRKEAAKRSKVRNLVDRASGSLWTLTTLGLRIGRGNRECSMAAKKTSRGGLEREMSSPVIDKNKKGQSDRSRETKICDKESSKGNKLSINGNKNYFGKSSEIARAPDAKPSIQRKPNSTPVTDLIGFEEVEEYCGPTNLPYLFPDTIAELAANKLRMMESEEEECSDESTDSQSESEAEPSDENHLNLVHKLHQQDTIEKPPKDEQFDCKQKKEIF